MTMLMPAWLFVYLGVGALLVARAVAESDEHDLAFVLDQPSRAGAITGLVLALILSVLVWPLMFVWWRR